MPRAHKKEETVQRMVGSLIHVARLEDVSLKGITVNNFNGFLDDAFKDGGNTRCERFSPGITACKFGELDSNAFDKAQWACIESAIRRIGKDARVNV